MPSPLYGADDPRRCSGSTKAEVLAKFSKNYDLIMSLPPETKEERNLRHCIRLAENEERKLIEQTERKAALPFRKPLEKYKEYIDPRMRNHRSRYGAISND